MPRTDPYGYLGRHRMVSMTLKNSQFNRQQVSRVNDAPNNRAIRSRKEPRCHDTAVRR